MSDEKYICQPQQRLMELIRALAGHEIDGMAPGEIAKLNACAPAQVTRDLANLRAFGWAEQIANTGRWRLGPQIVQLAMRHMAALDRAQRRLADTTNRYSRSNT